MGQLTLIRTHIEHGPNTPRPKIRAVGEQHDLFVQMKARQSSTQASPLRQNPTHVLQPRT